ncbi:MAG TPA: hypothetical protein PLG60_05700 [Acidimicrobiales bacterium]|nr:hypothetical protein [Acidimicrobiales bacterium]
MRTFLPSRARRAFRSALVSFASVSAASLLVVTGLTIASSGSASAATALPCNETVSTGPGAVQTTASGVLIVGVAAGTTQITINCNVTSGAAYALEASLLGGIGTSSVVASNEADLATLATFATSSTSAACPAASAGQCASTVLSVPATFSAGDANAACPATSTQIDAGLFSCAVAVVTGALAPIAGGEFLVTYTGQATPNAPTISSTPASAGSGATLSLSDAPGNTKFWFGNAVQAVQAATLGTAPLAAPASCTAATGYGNVPTAFLGVRYFAANSTTALVGSAAGVTLSNVCYDGSKLVAPALSGKVTLPAGLVGGTKYTGYLCELNATIYPSNDANALAHCGAAPAGASWIDASFPFTATAGALTQTAPLSGATSVSASAAFTATMLVTGASGAVTFTQHSPGSNLSVSSTGVVTTKKSLAAGVYTATGTTSDALGDTGVFSYTLTVGALTQVAPLTGATTTTASKSFTSQLVATGGVGAVTFTKTGGSPSLNLSSSGLVSTTSPLSAGSYTVTGTTADATGDAGTVTFALTVAAVKPLFHVTSLTGRVIEGRTVTIFINGAGFYGRPRVVSHVGTRAWVIRDNGHQLSVRVSAAAGSRNGYFTFTITLANGKSAKVRYLQVK